MARSERGASCAASYGEGDVARPALADADDGAQRGGERRRLGDHAAVRASQMTAPAPESASTWPSFSAFIVGLSGENAAPARRTP